MGVTRIQEGLLQFSPHARLGGLCFYIAWVEVIYSGDTFLSTHQMAYTYTAQMFPLSTIGLCVGLIVMALMPLRFYLATNRRSFMFVAALVGSLASLAVCFVEYEPYWCFIVAACLTGLATAVIAIRCAELVGEYDTKNALILMAVAQMVAVLIYSFVTATTFYFDSVPSIVLLCLLLPISVALLEMGDVSDVTMRDECTMRLPLGYWRLMVCIAVFEFACCSVRGYFPNLMNAGQFSQARWLTACVAILAMVVIMLGAAMMRRNAPFGMICYRLMLVLTFIFAFVPLFGIGADVSGVIATVLFMVMLLVTWAIVLRISYRSGAAIVRVFGFGYAAAAAGSTLGFIFGAKVLNGGIPESAVSTVSLIIILLCVAVAFFLLRKDDMESLMTPYPEDGEDPASIMEGVDPGFIGDDSDTPDGGGSSAKPMFRRRCEFIAGKYDLSSRETDVLFLMAKGNDAQAIADELYISFNTARTHIRNIYAKMDVHNRHDFFEVVNAPENRV